MSDSHKAAVEGSRAAGVRAARACVAAAALLAVLVWSYWPTLRGLIGDWRHDENYSVGQLVPLAALYLLWHRRRALSTCEVKTYWWGVLVLLAAEAARAFGLLFIYESAERYAMVLSAIGVVLLVAGWRVAWRFRWILVFLFLMVPLPGRVHNSISGPLQTLATSGAVILLELVGVTVAREGNEMVLNHEVHVAVAEACSGLRMLTAFVVVAAVLGYLVNRPRWQKFVLVCSSVPVAIACNLARLVATASLFLLVSSEAGERFFHDFAGLTMMPLAIVMLMGELWVMGKLVEEGDRGGVG